MTILRVAQKVSLKVGIEYPISLVTSTEREGQELFETIETVARAIIDEYDWQVLKVEGTITGDGTSTSFPFPADYARMLKKAKIWSSDIPNQPLEHITDTDAWLRDSVATFNPLYPQWTIYGGSIHIRPALAVGVTAKFFYIKRAFTATGKVAFDSDNDVFVLDENLLRLGTIVQWKIDKGLPYSEDGDAYNTAFSVLVGADKGSKVLTVGRQRSKYAVDVAFPVSLG